MTSNIQTEKVLKITGSDNVTFLDSIISNNIEVDSIKPSFLLGPDGKINHWFLIEEKNKEIFVYQDKRELNFILDSLRKYAIRIDCNFEIEDSKITLQVDLDKATFKTIETKEESVSWSDFELNNELPTKEIVNTGLLPNETKWLDFFVDFEKGCFLGQEQASRIKFRGKSRRMLVTNESGIQEIIKI